MEQTCSHTPSKWSENPTHMHQNWKRDCLYVSGWLHWMNVVSSFCLFSLCNPPVDAPDVLLSEWKAEKKMTFKASKPADSFFRSGTMTGLFGALCDLRHQDVACFKVSGLHSLASVNPRSHMTRAACPVCRGRHGPKTVTAGNKNTKGRKPSTLYRSINIDSEVCPGSLDSYSHKNKVIQDESAALQGSHYRSTNQKL